MSLNLSWFILLALSSSWITKTDNLKTPSNRQIKNYMIRLEIILFTINVSKKTTEMIIVWLLKILSCNINFLYINYTNENISYINLSKATTHIFSPFWEISCSKQSPTSFPICKWLNMLLILRCSHFRISVSHWNSS